MFVVLVGHHKARLWGGGGDGAWGTAERCLSDGPFPTGSIVAITATVIVVVVLVFGAAAYLKIR